MKLTTTTLLLAAIVKTWGVVSSSSSFLRAAAGDDNTETQNATKDDAIHDVRIREGSDGDGSGRIKSHDESLQFLMAQQRRIKREEKKENEKTDEQQQKQQLDQYKLPSSPSCAPLTVWFKTDKNKSDNEFYVFDFDSKTYLWDQWSFDEDAVYISKLCIKRDGCVGFHFIDDTGDGLQDDGYVRIYYDHILVHKGKEVYPFENIPGFGLDFYFGSNCDGRWKDRSASYATHGAA